MFFVEVHALPRHIPRDRLAGTTVVVTDVLRAATSMIWALEAGATEIIPVQSVDEARRIAATRDHCLLAGERKCLPIEGFDFGNSPRAFRATKTRGQSLVMTTTNGTAALLHCETAERVLVGAFANLTALARQLTGKSYHIVCAGTDADETEEDLLFAGALIELTEQFHADRQPYRRLGAAERASALWKRVGPEAQALTTALRESRGGRNLLSVGLQDDIADAATIDCTQHVAQYWPDRRFVRIASRTKASG